MNEVNGRTQGSSAIRFARTLLLSTLSSRYYVPALVAVAVLLRLAWMVVVPAEPVEDAAWYYKTGVAIAKGEGYSRNGMPTAWYPIGYPLFLGGVFSITGPSPTAGKIANLLLVLVTLLLVRKIGQTAFRSEVVGRLAMGGYALFPDSIFWSAQLASEPLFVALALGGTLCVLHEPPRWSKVVLAGLLFGCAVSVRPVGMTLPFVVLLARVLQDRRHSSWGARLREFCVLCVLMALVVVPWTVRNYHVFGTLVPLSTSGGFNLVIGNNPVASGVFQRDYATFQMVPEPYRTPCATSFDKYLWNPDGPALLGTTHETLNELSIDRACRRAAIRYVTEHPVNTIALFFKKAWLMYRADGGGAFHSMDQFARYGDEWLQAQKWARRVAHVTWLVLFGAFLGALIVLPRAARETVGDPPVFPWFGVVFIALFTAFTCVFYASGRYYAPMVPWICLYVAALIVWLLDLERGIPKGVDAKG